MSLRLIIQNEEKKEFAFDPDTGRWAALPRGKSLSLEVKRLESFLFSCRADSVSENTVIVEQFEEDTRLVTIRVNGKRVQVMVRDDLDAVADRTGATKGHMRKAQSLKSPMPGLVMKILVQPGAQVKKGDVLLILEAMKMENAIKAPADAFVAEVKCEAGQSVEKGSVLIEFR